MEKQLKDYTDRELIKAYVEAETRMEQLKQILPVLRQELAKRAEEKEKEDNG